jgi:hypothetical protein
MPIRKGRWVSWDTLIEAAPKPDPVAPTFPREQVATKSRRTRAAVAKAARQATGTRIEIKENQ